MGKRIHVWKKDDMAIAEYIKDEYASCRILKINDDNTADVILYISGKKIKKISAEEMTVPLSCLSVPAIIEKLSSEEFKNDEATSEI